MTEPKRSLSETEKKKMVAIEKLIGADLATVGEKAELRRLKRKQIYYEQGLALPAKKKVLPVLQIPDDQEQK